MDFCDNHDVYMNALCTWLTFARCCEMFFPSSPLIWQSRCRNFCRWLDYSVALLNGAHGKWHPCFHGQAASNCGGWPSATARLVATIFRESCVAYSHYIVPNMEKVTVDPTWTPGEYRQHGCGFATPSTCSGQVNAASRYSRTFYRSAGRPLWVLPIIRGW